MLDAKGGKTRTLDLHNLARRIRTVVHRGIYRRIAGRLTNEQAASLLQVLEADPSTGLTAFHRIKEVPKSATLTYLDEWLARLIWLQSLLCSPRS